MVIIQGVIGIFTLLGCIFSILYLFFGKVVFSFLENSFLQKCLVTVFVVGMLMFFASKFVECIKEVVTKISTRKRCTFETKAVVEKVQKYYEEYTSDSQTLTRECYAPTIIFSNTVQTIETIIIDKSKRFKNLYEGEEIEVFYNPNNVYEYVIGTKLNIAFEIFGALFISIFVCMLAYTAFAILKATF